MKKGDDGDELRIQGEDEEERDSCVNPRYVGECVAGSGSERQSGEVCHVCAQ